MVQNRTESAHPCSSSRNSNRLQKQFFLACEAVSKATGEGLPKNVMGQIMALDDFLTFKKMMQKRNRELELEAVRALERAAGGPMSPIRAPKDSKEEEDQLAEALRISKEEADAAALLAECKVSSAGEKEQPKSHTSKLTISRIFRPRTRTIP